MSKLKCEIIVKGGKINQLHKSGDIQNIKTGNREKQPGNAQSSKISLLIYNTCNPVYRNGEYTNLSFLSFFPFLSLLFSNFPSCYDLMNITDSKNADYYNIYSLLLPVVKLLSSCIERCKRLDVHSCLPVICRWSYCPTA